MDLNNFALNPVTLALLILGLVEFIKKFGVSGNKLLIIAMVVGIVFGLVYKLTVLFPAYAQYIEIVFFGVAAGLCASGIYSFVNARFPAQTKATIKYTRVVKSAAADKEEAIQ